MSNIQSSATAAIMADRCFRRRDWPEGRALLAKGNHHAGMHYIIEGGHTGTFAPTLDDVLAVDWYVTDENEHAAVIREVSQHVWADDGSPRYPELQDI